MRFGQAGGDIHAQPCNLLLDLLQMLGRVRLQGVGPRQAQHPGLELVEVGRQLLMLAVVVHMLGKREQLLAGDGQHDKQAGHGKQNGQP